MMQQAGGGGLPAEYQEVEYLQSSGTQYIIVPFSYNQTFTRLECRFIAFNDSSWVFGGWNSSSASYGVNLDTYSGWRFKANGDLMSLNFDMSVNREYELLYDGSSVQCNGRSSLYRSYKTDNSNGELMLFGLTYTQGGNRAYLKYASRIYKFIIEGTADSFSLIPCVRNSDNEAGMYDIVNNVFYTNAGTGSFIVGNPV